MFFPWPESLALALALVRKLGVGVGVGVGVGQKAWRWRWRRQPGPHLQPAWSERRLVENRRGQRLVELNRRAKRNL